MTGVAEERKMFDGSRRRKQAGQIKKKGKGWTGAEDGNRLDR
jgi:hypothetical protein